MTSPTPTDGPGTPPALTPPPWTPGPGNLSAWALAHRTLILFFVLASVVAGLVAYQRLGRAEDPSFTFKTMTIRTEWPGATAREVEQLVTDPLQKKLEELPYYDFSRSYSKPGQSVIFLNLKDSTPPSKVADLWYQVRKKIGDIRGDLPQGTYGPYFNDEFGDVYAMIYAFTGLEHGFSPPQLKKIVEEVRERLLRLPDVEKVDLFATQDERITVEISSRRLASFGLPLSAVVEAIQRDNAIAAAGSVDTSSDRIYVRVDLGFDKVAAVRDLPIGQVGGRQVTISDVAEVSRGTIEPRRFVMRYQGRDAIGLGVVMAKGGNVLALGQTLAAEMAKIRAEQLPAGVEVAQVNDQPEVVERSVNDFLKSLTEALAIVMAVSFLSLGWRCGVVVALAVPLVLALTAALMLLLGIDLQRISLGALIIALGLLVDDAIIAVETMLVKIEQGWDRLRAGAFAYASTAFPMLSGTVVTAAGFVPVGFAASAAGEYTNSIFWVLAVSLMVSWVVAVLVTPYFGYYLLKAKPHPASAAGHDHDLYQSGSYRVLRAVISACVRARWLVLVLALATFVASVIGFGQVQQQFFPSANRPELLVDLRLPEGTAFEATSAEAARLEGLLKNDADVRYAVAYVGGGSPRFYLPLDQQLENANFVQLMVMTRDLEARERVAQRLENLADRQFPQARMRVGRLENGPPVGYPVQFRISGSDPAKIRAIAAQVRDRVRAHPNTTNINFDWDELAKRVRVEVDPAKARALGVSKQDLSQSLQLLLSGLTVSQYREDNELIDIALRAAPAERLDLSRLGDLTVLTGSGVAVPLAQVATLHYELEEPILWRRGRDTTMVVRADVSGNIQAPTVSLAIEATLGDLRAALPDGYRIEVGGAIEESGKGQGSIVAMLPLMLLIMVTTLMLQLQSFSRVALVLLTAPLGLIGVTGALLLSGLPFGFVATLGVIALAGIIMRNSVILVDQIDQDIRGGSPPWQAIIDATVRRARPISLTAAAAILAMIPLAENTFWAPMAVAMMGGLAVATLLTLLFLPALYAIWFRITPAKS